MLTRSSLPFFFKNASMYGCSAYRSMMRCLFNARRAIGRQILESCSLVSPGETSMNTSMSAKFRIQVFFATEPSMRTSGGRPVFLHSFSTARLTSSAVDSTKVLSAVLGANLTFAAAQTRSSLFKNMTSKVSSCRFCFVNSRIDGPLRG